LSPDHVNPYNVKELKLKETSKKGQYRLNYRNEKCSVCDSHKSEQNYRGGCGYNASIEKSTKISCGCTRERNNNTNYCKNNTVASRNRYRRTGGGCGTDNGFLKEETPLGMVYSPNQQWRELYDPHTALAHGTLFKELDLPFYPTPCNKREGNSCQ